MPPYSRCFTLSMVLSFSRSWCSLVAQFTVSKIKIFSFLKVHQLNSLFFMFLNDFKNQRRHIVLSFRFKFIEIYIIYSNTPRDFLTLEKRRKSKCWRHCSSDVLKVGASQEHFYYFGGGQIIHWVKDVAGW
jgi:hypothetical protein